MMIRTQLQTPATAILAKKIIKNTSSNINNSFFVKKLNDYMIIIMSYIYYFVKLSMPRV